MGFVAYETSGAIKVSDSTSEFTTTSTGNIDNLNFSNAALIRMNNATLTTVRGLVAGQAGQTVTIVSIGAGQVEFAHQNANSAEANRLINFATSANTPLAAGVGSATYQYDVTTARWRMVSHDQGATILPAFDAGVFTGSDSMTWTVASGDRLAYSYYLQGRLLYVNIYVQTSTVGGTPSNSLQVTVPGGFSATRRTDTPMFADNNGTRQIGHLVIVEGTTLLLGRLLADGNWAAATDTSGIRTSMSFEVN